MKQKNYQEIHAKTNETSSSNENNKKQTIIIEEDSKKLLRPKGAIVCREHKRTPTIHTLQLHIG